MSEKHEIQVRFLSLAPLKGVNRHRQLNSLLCEKYLDHVANEVNEGFDEFVDSDGDALNKLLRILSADLAGIVGKVVWHTSEV